MNREEAKRKAEELVGKMTIEERAGQLSYNAPAIPRLNIPAYNWWNEGIHGVARAGTATVFPQAIGMAAAFDEKLIAEMADCVATEGRAKYNAYAGCGDRDIYKGLTFWSPNVNIFRDPRWGRGHETYGEDPYLTSRLGVAYVKALQGNGEHMKAAACAKHYAVHSGPEALRHEFNAKATPKDMEDTYLPAFEALVKEAGVEAVMGAYNRTNGEPCCGSKILIQDILREKWGFEGHFVSDCWAIRDFHERHMVTSSARESAAMALNAGCDLNCGNTYLHILSAYEEGLVTEEAITQAAVRLFTTRFLLGMFDGSEYDSIPYEVVDCEAHKRLAERAAEESIVLLKNDGILPLNKEEIKTIGVIGPNADSRKALIGNYHGTASEYITVLEGIRNYTEGKVRILYSEGCQLAGDRTEPLAFEDDRIAEAKITALHSDVVVLCVGLDETLEGEEGDTGNSYASGDKIDLQLPAPQRRLLEAVAQTKKPVILCLMTGSAMDLGFAAEHFNAVVQLWYPGARGGKSAADILFGEVSPSGKLPVTFYESLKELPEFEDYSMKGRTYRYMKEKGQFPFGYGLTYGRTEVTEAFVENADHSYGDGAESGSAEKSARIRVRAVLENTGRAETDEVLQIYIRSMDSKYAAPNPVLCGFKRLHLGAGEKCEAVVDIAERAFTVVDDAGERLLEKGRFEIYAGISQPDERSIELTGTTPVRLEVEL
ncbi:MAG: glycoside hydrolase family 3 protein [Clostridiales bacterium]|nr:glycoside hydrolase family 3 protein [Clostridiales bacterium]